MTLLSVVSLGGHVLLAMTLLQVAGAKQEVPLVTFDGAKATSYTVEPVNDPVMGGQSESTFQVDAEQAVGVWDGEVKIVPFLKAPGFCALNAPGLNKKASFPDVSGTKGIVVVAREASKDGLKQFNVQLMAGATHLYFMEAVYEAHFTLGDTLEPQLLTWDKFECSWHGKKVSWCPELSTRLGHITNVGLSTHGTAGKFRVELAKITTAAASASLTSSEQAEIVEKLSTKMETASEEAAASIGFLTADAKTVRAQHHPDMPMMLERLGVSDSQLEHFVV